MALPRPGAFPAKPVPKPKPVPDAFPELVEEPAKPEPVKIDPKNLDQYMAFPKSPKGKNK